MADARCYHCGSAVAVEPEVVWPSCGGCGRFVHAASARSLAAVERLIEAADAEADLGDAARRELIAWLRRQQQQLSAAALALPGPVLPPPLPVAAPAAVVAEAAAEPTIPAAPPSPFAPPSLPGPPWREPPPRRASGPWARLGPLFAENLLFALAGFLLVAGAVYFTTTAWTTMSGSTQKLVVAGGLLLFAALLHAAGAVLGKDAALRVAARALSLVAIALAPSASAVASLLHAENRGLALVAAGAAAVAGHWFLVALVRREGHLLPRLVVWLTDAMVFAGVFAVPWVDRRVVLAVVVAVVLLGIASCVRRGAGAIANAPSAALCALSGSVFAALAIVVGTAMASGAPFAAAVAPLGIVVAAVALAATVLEGAAATRSPVTLTVALSAGISAVLLATGDVRCVMVSAWCAAAVGLLASLRLERARLLAPALVLSAIGYLFLPAPVRELATQLREQAAGQLGYAPQRLPLSFYGITFLPYLAGLALLCAWLRRAGHGRHRRVCSGFGISIAAGLAAMSLLLGRDLRAPMAVLPADGLLLVLLGYLGQSQRAVFAGCLGVLGGIVCALVWCEAPGGVATATMATAALLLAWLARPATGVGFVSRARGSYLVAAACTTLGVALWPATCVWPLDRQSAWNLLHAAALTPLWCVWRRREQMPNGLRWQLPAVVLLAVPALWATATGVAAVLQTAGFAALRTAMPGALALVTAATAAWVGRLRLLPEGERAQRYLAIGLFACQALLVADVANAYSAQHLAWNLVAGLAGLAFAAGWLALRVRADVLLAIAVVTGAYPLHLLAIAGFGTAVGPPGLVGPTLLAIVVAWRGARRAPVAAAAAGLAALFGLLLLAWRLDAIPAVPSTLDAATTLGVAVAIAGIAGWRAARQRRESGVADVGWAMAGCLASVTAPFALLDLFVTDLSGYAWGTLALGGLVCAAAARARRLELVSSVYGLLFLMVATGLWFLWQPADDGAHRQRLLGFVATAAAAVCCRPRELRTPATLVTLAAGFGAIVVQPVALQWVASAWWTVPWLGACALALLVSAQPRWASRAFAVRLVAWPSVGAAAVMLAATALFALAGRQARLADELLRLDANALALLLAAATLAAHVGVRWRPLLVGTAVTVAALVTIPLNGLLQGQRRVASLPDAEAALLALAVAIAFAGRPQARVASGVLAVAAALLTAFALTNVSTPVTMTLLAGVPLALLLRRVPGPFAVVHGAMLLLAAWSWIAFVLVGRDAVRVGPWLAASAAVVGGVSGPWLRFVGGAALAAGQLLALRAACWLLAIAALLAACAAGRIALPTTGLVAALAASAIVGVGSAGAARRQGQAPLVHLALAAMITAYLVLAVGADVLAPLRGSHHHALTVLGATLFLVAGSGDAPLWRHLRAAAVATPLLAVALASGLGGLTFSLLAGAGVMALGAVVARARGLAALSLVLANSGLFHLWLHEGVFDPSFYGVPAGLSLVFGAELARAALGGARVVALRVAGLAVLYGSVLVQIARVAVPMHALVLFVLAMAAVAYGVLRQQTAVLVTGVVAVVLDVVVYLAQRGFEQDFLGSVLLVGAGLSVFAVAARAARRRSRGVSALPPPN